MRILCIVILGLVNIIGKLPGPGFTKGLKQKIVITLREKS